MRFSLVNQYLLVPRFPRPRQFPIPADPVLRSPGKVRGSHRYLTDFLKSGEAPLLHLVIHQEYICHGRDVAFFILNILYLQHEINHGTFPYVSCRAYRTHRE